MQVSGREASIEYQRKESKSKRDIGEIPATRNPDRKDRGSKRLSCFCREYQSNIFTRPFSEKHKEVLHRMEAAVCTGGLFAYAMPRGTGKTSIAEAAVIWAILTGRRRYVVLIAATDKQGSQGMENIKIELSTNEAILEDWPMAVYPMWMLEGISHRAAGQLWRGDSTHLTWRGEKVVFPSILGSKCSGSLIEVRGITGAIRGMKHNLPGGKGTLRPELVILDDPQTDESARSMKQCQDRERTILGTILGLKGHEEEISVVMPCTVIHKGDLAEKFLDNEVHPKWNGVRAGLLTTMPVNIKLWDEYNDLKKIGDEIAHKFYIENREAMDEGAVPMWNECFNKNQLSAIQYAMDLRSTVGEIAFWAEYQNDPLDDASDGEQITIDGILEKTTSHTRWQVPTNCQHLTAHIDIHLNALYYMVCGWDEQFNGYIIQYGTWPETKRRYFSLSDIQDTLQKKYPGRGPDGAIYAGLQDLTKKLLTHRFVGKEGFSGLSVGKLLIDANWKTSLVKSFCRESDYSAIVIPAHGRYIGADRKQLNDYRKSAGDRLGLAWRIPAALSRDGVRHVLYDTNHWKSFVNSSLLSPPGERGCLQLFGKYDHRLLAEHLTAEYFVEVSGRGRQVNQWSLHPGRRDNHWLDDIVGCAVGASMVGCQTLDTTVAKRVRRPIKYLSV